MVNQDKHSHIGSGSVVRGVISTGDNANIKLQYNEAPSEINVYDEVTDIFGYLSMKYSQYPNASDEQKEDALRREIQEKVELDPGFRGRLVNALRYGGVELTKVVTNNPFISVPLETVRGWVEAG